MRNFRLDPILYFDIKFEVSILRKIINSLESIINSTEKGAIYRKVLSKEIIKGLKVTRIYIHSQIFLIQFLVQYNNSFRNFNQYMRNT